MSSLVILGVAALTVLGLLALAGNLLFDFALNPQARFSILGRLRAGELEGVDSDQFNGNPQLDGARAWFERAKQSVALRASDGTELLGWFVPPEPADACQRKYAVLCHGFAGRPSDNAVAASYAHAAGFAVLMPAARAHERNGRGYVQMGWRDSADLVEWLGELVHRDPGSRIVLYGVSMGGAEVMMASGRDLPSQVRCIVEDCGYTSVWDEFCVQLRMLFHLPPHPLLDAASLVCRLRAGFGFREASAVRQLRRARVPMLFIHGADDIFVPAAMLDALYEACASPVKERLLVEGASHGAAAFADPERYWGTVARFVEEHI